MTMGFFRYVFLICVLHLMPDALIALGRDCIISPSSSYPSHCSQERFREFVNEKNFRPAIALIDQWVQESKNPTATAFLYVEKAKILYADQQHAEAQELFLQALQTLPTSSQGKISDAEKNAFDKLFPSYEEASVSPEACSRLLEESEAVYKNHPEFESIEHYIAACLANRGQFIEFFDRFFHAFQVRRDCFLTYKTIGVLHLRLFEASSSEERRQMHRQEAVICLKEAFSREPKDSTLLVKLVFILPPMEKQILLRSVSVELTKLQTPIRRMDCFFLIQQAMDVGELEVAKQLIEKAHSWYQYSRALHELSDQLSALEAFDTGNPNIERRY